MQESPDKFTIEIPEVTNAQNELIKFIESVILKC